MSLLGRKFLSKRSRSRKRPGALSSISFELAESIGILYTWEDNAKEAEVNQFIDSISEGRNISCLCFNEDKNINPETHHPIFDFSQLSMLGNIESTETTQFLLKPFNYLFHLDLELNETCQALLSTSQAQYRVGLHTEEGEKFYELMIGINKSAGLHNFAGQMLKYVNAMK